LTEEAVPVEASSLPVSDKPVTLSFKGGSTTNKLSIMAARSGPVKHVATTALGFTTDNPDAPNTEEDEALKGSNAEGEKSIVFKKVAPLIASKKVANNISKWNTVQEELSNKASSATAPAAPTLDTSTSELSRGSAVVIPALAAPIPGIPEDEFEFADTKSFACLLCSRQFKSIEQLRRHNKESDLHKARSLTLCTRILLDTALTFICLFFSLCAALALLSNHYCATTEELQRHQFTTDRCAESERAQGYLAATKIQRSGV